ncbi:MAG: hypothetical protein M1828_002310 [Chrysothrix sp. TS-e1954]|nr:MAG: hypothetical protein M1828_002310 [Chrysothrix sp. TS-e1954]
MRSALFDTLTLAGTAGSAPSAIPAFLYGCAWKRSETANLVHKALSSGFRGIDVAAQPRHYREDLAGEGMRRAIGEGRVKRGDIFVQSKFTAVPGQDPGNIPYEPRASVKEQVTASVQSSLRNLRVEEGVEDVQGTYLDSLVLHSPLSTLEKTMEAWEACERFVPHEVKFLGISNTPLDVLEALYAGANVKPSIVQNRFYRDTGYDVALRRFCRDRGIVYQSFWSLTANGGLMKIPHTAKVANAADVEPAVVIYCFILGLEDTVVLNGTQNHMESDLRGLEKVREWARANSYEWEDAMKHFKDAIGETGPSV